jgi:hypothetical protein
MDPFFNSVLTEDTSVITLLILFIICLLTKRIVPWWIYDEVVKKLDDYEKSAPGLVDEVARLVEIIDNTYEDEPRHITKSPRKTTRRNARNRAQSREDE